MAKRKLTIQERDLELRMERANRGYRNRQDERRSEHPHRKNNCRKLTLGRIKYRMDVNGTIF